MIRSFVRKAWQSIIAGHLHRSRRRLWLHRNRSSQLLPDVDAEPPAGEPRCALNVQRQPIVLIYGRAFWPGMRVDGQVFDVGHPLGVEVHGVVANAFTARGFAWVAVHTDAGEEVTLYGQKP